MSVSPAALATCWQQSTKCYLHYFCLQWQLLHEILRQRRTAARLKLMELTRAHTSAFWLDKTRTQCHGCQHVSKTLWSASNQFEQ